MSYTLVIPPKILKKLKKLDPVTKERITEKIEEILTDPTKFKLLRYELKGLRSARVGKWRIIYEIDNDKIVILSVSLRKKAYDRGI